MENEVAEVATNAKEANEVEEDEVEVELKNIQLIWGYY